MSIKYSCLFADGIISNYETESAAGFELYTIEDVCLKPFQKKVVASNVTILNGIELCDKNDKLFYCGKICGKSRLIYEDFSIIEGTIDADYRGLLKIQIKNDSLNVINIPKHSNVAQFVILQIGQAININRKDVIRTGGFGSTK